MMYRVVDSGDGDWCRRVRGGGGSDANAHREHNTGNINYNAHAITWPNNTTYSDTHTNTNTETRREIFSGSLVGLIDFMFLSRNGAIMAAATREGAVKTWQISSGRTLLSEKVDFPIANLLVSPDGTLLTLVARAIQGAFGKLPSHLIALFWLLCLKTST
jgi:hypothetical protein